MQTAFILGGTKGLGKEIALLCQAKGWRTIAVGSSAEEHDAGHSVTRRCDLTDTTDVKALCNYIAGQRIDHFFWVAGRIIKGKFHELTTDDILRTVDVNYRSSLLVAHAVWKQMHDTKTPKSFVVVASSSGRKPRSDEQVYAGTKHALVGTVASLGLENENPHLHVLLVLPGGMRTPFWDRQPHPDYATFLDPRKVAARIVEVSTAQTTPYAELEIPRGSL